MKRESNVKSKIANAYFLANDLDKAISKYKDIVEDTHSKARETKEAYYQLVATYEKKWRMITSGEMSGKPTKTLNKLKTYTLGYSNNQTLQIIKNYFTF